MDRAALVINKSAAAEGVEAEPDDDEQHSAEPLLRLHLERRRRADRGRNSLSDVRPAPQSDYCGRRDEPLFCFVIGNALRLRSVKL